MNLAMSQSTETILQFGTGRFLRAFADFFVSQARAEGQSVGKIVIVQSSGDDMVKQLNASSGKFHVIVRGLENGEVIDRVEPITSVSRAISAATHWNDLKELACSPDLQIILSNTTEAGFQLDATDSAQSSPPKSFPGKLLLLLQERFKRGLSGLTIIPCELMEGNASLLRNTLQTLSSQWELGTEFTAWLAEKNIWLNTLVDRIVTGTPREHPILAEDPLAIVAEPFGFWALEILPGEAPFITHPLITRTTDVLPYFLRKVRILNAAHTALLIKAMPRGFKIVREAVNDPELGSWLRELLFKEIVPCLEGRVDQPERFAEQTIERFKNPFLEHKFSDIYLHHESKMKIRLVTTMQEYQSRFGEAPKLLSEVIDQGFADLGKN
jgi:tagaturonate reductase